MPASNRSLRQVPFWSYIIVLLVIAINAVNFYYKMKVPYDGLVYDRVKGSWVVTGYRHISAGFKAGIRPGDIVLSVNSKPFERYLDKYDGKKAGDQVIFQILRHDREVSFRVRLNSSFSNFTVFFVVLFLFVLVLCLTSLFLLFKKRGEGSVILFFLYLQFIAVCINAWHIPFRDLPALVANTAFIICGSMMGPVLIHFHLLFPKPVKFRNRIKVHLGFIYLAGVMLIILQEVFPDLSSVVRFDLKWATLTFLLAMAVAICRFFEFKDTLSRNRLRIVIIGSFFGFVIPVLYTFFYDFINKLGWEVYTIIIPHGIGSMIMICCILIAIFRFRIWDIEVVIRKALLYLGATTVIILSYLFLVWLVDQFTAGTTDLLRFAALTASVILFLILRDRIQHLIDRMFHRETFDPATVVSEFEAKLAGVYRPDELKEKIVRGMDDIFHFKSLLFGLKKDHLLYEPAYVLGLSDTGIPSGLGITPEMDDKLRKAKVFSPEELSDKPPFLQTVNGELVVPMVASEGPAGFFLCGQKKSERIYSRQEINVLSLLARRVVALLHTANLYQKDRDRQLMLERERARISQDMHDDIGAGLTKIAMISEAPVKTNEQGKVNSEQMLKKIASSAREMISRLNVIVWALNPKYDNIESLLSYLRRFFSEYLENGGIELKTDFGDEIPDIPITPDARRNIFYAVQEAVHNAVKHSGCSEIGLSFETPPLLEGEGVRGVRLTITDNGKGFDTVKPGSGGNGLLNMKKRAEEMEGRFEIESSTGEGTRVIFMFKLA